VEEADRKMMVDMTIAKLKGDVSKVEHESFMCQMAQKYPEIDFNPPPFEPEQQVIVKFTDEKKENPMDEQWWKK
jgi:hypothetical protein